MLNRTYYVRLSEALACTVTVSDQPWKGDLSVTAADAVTGDRIRRAAERKLGLPCTILETDRLLIRELTAEDAPFFAALDPAELSRAFSHEARQVFIDPEALAAYVRTQYPLWEFGIFGLCLKREESGGPGEAVRGCNKMDNSNQTGGRPIGVVPETTEPSSGETVDTGTTEPGNGETVATGTTEPGNGETVDTGICELGSRELPATGPADAAPGTAKAAGAGQIVGIAGFSMAETDLPELGYLIRQPFRGQGLCSEACEALLRYAEEELGFTEVEIRVQENNQPGRKTAERLMKYAEEVRQTDAAGIPQLRYRETPQEFC